MHNRLLRINDSLAWYTLLAFIAIAGFLNQGFAEPAWLWFSGCFYAFCAWITLGFSLGGRCNKKALRSAKPVVVLLVLSLVWLWLPLWLDYSHALYDLLQVNNRSDSPDWFVPSSRWSVAPDRGRWLFLSELFFAVFFIVVLLLLDSRRRLKQLLFVVAAVGVLHASVGLFAKFANVLFVDAEQIDGHFSAARGLFINRNHFGAFLVLCSVPIFAYVMRAGVKSNSGSDLIKQYLAPVNMLALIAFGLILAACIASESRGALLALLVASTFGIVAMGLQKRRFTRGLLIGLSVAVLVAFAYFGQGLLTRFVNDSLSFGERPTQWRITLNAIAQNPLFGYGGGSYGTVFQMFRDGVDLRQVFFAQSHNHYLHLWLERGLIGLAMWLAIWVYVLRFIRQNMRYRNSTLVLASLCAIMMGLIASLLQSMVDFNLQILNIRAYFMMLMAVAFALPSIKHR